jgi:ABC-2 type transport system permease protein
VNVVRGFFLLLEPKWRSTMRRGAGARGRAGRALLLLGVGAAAWPFVYFTLVRFLRALRGVEDVGPLLASRLLALGFLIFLGILLLSNVIAALSSYFLARDLPAIRTTPVDGLSLYLARLTETLVSSSWMVVLLLVPALAAYGRAYGAGPGFAFVAIAGVVPFLVIPAAVGSALTLLLVRIFPARRSRDILAVIGLGSAALLILVLRVLRPERLVDPESYRNLIDFLEALRGPSSTWLPSQWTADVLIRALEGTSDPLSWLLLWTTAAGVTTLGAMLHQRLYAVCFTRAQEGDENRLTRTAGWRGLEWLLAPLGIRRRELILKDVRAFFRDPTQWSQLIILAVLVVVYVYNMRALPLRTGTAISGYLTTLVLFLNLALTGFVLAAIAARFVFPAFSLEGRTLWLLRSSPVSASEILASKFWTGAIPLTGMALILTVMTNLVLGVPHALFLLSLGSILCMSLAFTAQALAWGVFYPQFESENAAQIPTSIGGLLFMLGALGSLGFVVVAQGWALRGYLASGLPGRVPRVARLEEIGVAFGITLGVALLTGVTAMMAAERQIRIGGRD